MQKESLDRHNIQRQDNETCKKEKGVEIISTVGQDTPQRKCSCLQYNIQGMQQDQLLQGSVQVSAESSRTIDHQGAGGQSMIRGRMISPTWWNKTNMPEALTW